MIRLEWVGDPVRQFHYALGAYKIRLRYFLWRLLSQMSLEIREWMQENAPWTDRTFRARMSLWATTSMGSDIVSLMFGHGVYYGIFLETMSLGEFGIVLPAVDMFSVELVFRLQAAGFRVTRGVTTQGMGRPTQFIGRERQVGILNAMPR